jgi:hypothetical protein
MPKQEKNNSHKCESTNTFFPSYSLVNLVTISTDIPYLCGLYLSRRAVKPMPIVGLYLTFKQALNVITSNTVYSSVSRVERCWSCVLLLCNEKLYKKNRYSTYSRTSL